jgi:hypothetical protein
MALKDDKVTGDRGALDTVVENNLGMSDAEQDADFGDAFKEAAGVSEGGNADLSAADNPDNLKDGDGADKPVVQDKATTVTVATKPNPDSLASTAAVTDPATITQQPGESDEKFEQRYKTLQGIHKHDKEAWETERANLLAQIEEAKKPKAPDKPADVTKKKDATTDIDTTLEELTPEQKAELEAYEKDFDVVSKMEGKKRQVELAKLRKEFTEMVQGWKDELLGTVNEVKSTLDTKIAPALQYAEDSNLEAHLNVIRTGYKLEDGTVISGHPDFETYRDDGSLLKWIESKPKYLQPAMKKVYQEGTAEEVIDLYSDFKKENNIVSQPEIDKPADNVTQISDAKRSKKQALTTVTTRRGAVNTAAASGSDDFEGAFEEAVRK